MGPSEHGVIVRRALRYGLQDIPVLDDLAVLQAEEVRRGGAAVFGRSFYQAVRHNHVALGDGTPDVEAQLGELLYEALHELDERLEAVWCLGVVLDVVRSAVLFHRLGRLPVVERQIVVGEHRLLVLLGIGHGSSFVCAPPKRAGWHSPKSGASFRDPRLSETGLPRITGVGNWVNRGNSTS